MKKTLLLIMAFALVATLKAQTPILSEGFEGQQFPPQGWTRESLYLSSFTWFRGAALYTYDWWGNQYHVVPPQGARMAALESDYYEDWGPQDESLITPWITIERPSALTFETFCQYGHPEYRDHYRVDVSDANGTWTTLWDGAEQPNVWLNQFEETISIDLSAYQGQDIKLRFRGYNEAGEVLTYSWFIDDVKVFATDTIPNTVNETALQASIYPNPVDRMITLQSTEVTQKVCIYNILGIKVKEIAINSQRAVIDLSELPSGAYVIELFYDNHQKVTQSLFHFF